LGKPGPSPLGAQRVQRPEGSESGKPAPAREISRYAGAAVDGEKDRGARFRPRPTRRGSRRPVGVGSGVVLVPMIPERTPISVSGLRCGVRPSVPASQARAAGHPAREMRPARALRRQRTSRDVKAVTAAPRRRPLGAVEL